METQTITQLDVNIIVWCCREHLEENVLKFWINIFHVYTRTRYLYWAAGFSLETIIREDLEEIGKLLFQHDLLTRRLSTFDRTLHLTSGLVHGEGFFSGNYLKFSNNRALFSEAAALGTIEEWLSGRGGKLSDILMQKLKQKLSWGQDNCFEFSGPCAQDFVLYLCYSHFFSVIYSFFLQCTWQIYLSLA